jgi:hypothetical protein
MATHRVGDGKTIHWRGGAMAGGQDVPAEYIAELIPESLASMVSAGTLVDLAPSPKRARMASAEDRP